MKKPKDSSGETTLPPGVDWMPVSKALKIIHESFQPKSNTQCKSVSKAVGSIVSEPIYSVRANPPATNSAVDGYGFSYKSLSGSNPLKIIEEQIEPGTPFLGILGKGEAVKILTGSQIPQGVDTVLMEEEASIQDDRIAVKKPIKKGLNIRVQGEDVKKGDLLFSKGQRIGSSDVATLIASGVKEVSVYQNLQVAVLSTGNELVAHQNNLLDYQVLDTNRPMLLAMIRRWGFDPIDLGFAVDCPESIRQKLDEGSDVADVILTTGGASSGNKDFISKLLKNEGEIFFWRIAVKPGRPLVFAQWKNAFVFGLPGNPIAAFVCALIFGLPLLKQLAGEVNWRPLSYKVPAGFDKNKKAGRTEYWRSRINPEGYVDIFGSEGSGLTTSLLWSNGLVEVEEQATSVRKGDLVKFIPYSSFEQS